MLKYVLQNADVIGNSTFVPLREKLKNYLFVSYLKAVTTSNIKGIFLCESFFSIIITLALRAVCRHINVVLLCVEARRTPVAVSSTCCKELCCPISIAMFIELSITEAYKTFKFNSGVI